jgi:hypothetical protein
MNKLIFICEFLKDMIVLIGMSYLYFWKGVSGWWWLLAIILLASHLSSSIKEK